MANLTTLRAVVYGRVQGVFYRSFIARHAGLLNVNGYARNLPGGVVEVQAEGEREKLESLIELLKKGPPTARVDKVEINWSEYIGSYTGFKIR